MMRTRYLIPIGILFLNCLSPAYAEETELVKEKIRKLEQRLEKLEKEKNTDTQAPTASRNTVSESSTSTGVSRAFNPAISANVLALGTYVDQGNADQTRETRTGMRIQEVELVFSSWVDTWLKADLVLSIEGTQTVNVEETIAEILVAQNLSFKAGKFYSSFGKHNRLHTHAFPFIDPPLVNEDIFGEEGLNEIGVGLSYLLPLPYFSELSFQFLEGSNDVQFNGKLNDDFLYLANLKNLWDLTDDVTLEAGGSFATGKNDVNSRDYDTTYVSGADLTFKWKPGGRERHQTLIWQTEFLTSSRDQVRAGAYTMVQYQFARSWWIQGRYDFSTIKENVTEEKNRWSTLLAFAPSEFSAFRLQYNRLNHFTTDEHQVFLQLNYTFGSHPAHNY